MRRCPDDCECRIRKSPPTAPRTIFIAIDEDGSFLSGPARTAIGAMTGGGDRVAKYVLAPREDPH